MTVQTGTTQLEELKNAHLARQDISALTKLATHGRLVVGVNMPPLVAALATIVLLVLNAPQEGSLEYVQKVLSLKTMKTSAKSVQLASTALWQLQVRIRIALTVPIPLEMLRPANLVHADMNVQDYQERL